MKNTLKNKAKFFAQYFGQKVIFNKFTPKLPFIITDINDNNVNGEILELTSISNMGGVLVTEIGILIDFFPYPTTGRIINDELVQELRDELSYKLEWEVSFELCAQVIDLIRSKGYALPYMGLSVETLVEYGWVKLKSP